MEVWYLSGNEICLMLKNSSFAYYQSYYLEQYVNLMFLYTIFLAWECSQDVLNFWPNISLTVLIDLALMKKVYLFYFFTISRF